MSPAYIRLPSLCPSCEKELSSLGSVRLENFGTERVRVLFRYEGLIRTLIMRSKVKNDAVSVGFLCHLVKKISLNQFNYGPGVFVIPAPPSFWGRMRGRFDLAEVLALSLFGQSQVFQGHLPGLSWHAKRAGRNSGTTHFFNEKSSIYKYFNSFNPGLNFLARLSSATQILVVDDVMTTGLTMRTIFNQLKELGAQSVEGLVIASSSKV